MLCHITQGMSHVRRIRPLAGVLLAVGAGLLALSFILEPTPTPPCPSTATPRARRQDRVTVLAVVVFAVLAAVTAYLYVAKRPR